VAGSSGLYAQSLADDLLGAGIEVRHTFDGAKLESKPALFEYYNDMNSDSADYSAFDIAVKYKFWDNDEESFALSLVGELHNKTVNSDLEADDSYNKLSFGLNGQYYGKECKREITARYPVCEEEDFRLFSPIVTASVSGTRDYKDDAYEGYFAVNLTSFSLKTGFPGSNINDENGITRLRYYPYIGFERFEGVSDDIKNLTFFKTRGYAEVNLFKNGMVQAIIEYTCRFELGSEEFDAGLQFFAPSLNLNLTDNLSLSFNYEAGKKSSLDFESIQAYKFGIGFKI
jgi:hypothetical protein